MKPSPKKMEEEQRLRTGGRDSRIRVHQCGSALQGFAATAEKSYSGYQIVQHVLTAEADDVVRLGTGVSRTLYGTGGGVQGVKGAQQASALGSGTVGAGRIVVSTFTVSFATVGAVLSVYTAVQSLKHPDQNAPLSKLCKDAVTETRKLVQELECSW